MSQPWQQPQQPPQPNPNNPYLQAPAQPSAPPQMPPAPPQGYPQQPMQPGFPQQQQPYPGGFPQQLPYPGGPQQPRSGSPVGAVFLGLLVSFVLAAIYAGIWFATYKDMDSDSAVRGLYFGHAVINGALTGLIVGMVAGRSNGAHVGAGIIAALGAFFGFANGYVCILFDQPNGDFILKHTPLLPAKAWWATGGEVSDHLLSVLGVLLAGGIAWGLAAAVGRRR
ncbi:hypothetical protein [Streptomyces sp. NBC_01465]|uniref:hypothetical protein n=1 Tax=Streptomyces sp. NBC_01465 TaxID=2903878 RepID=UPI002E363604|nr:hypothetical protein [Streptomyces sp. NBC_01465]